MGKTSFDILIWSFGTSDIYLNGEPINTKQENFLEKTRDIINNWEEYKDMVSFPIFEQFIDQVVNGRFDDIIVKGIFTDQGGHKQDTIYLKDIFQRWLESKFGNKIKFARNHIILDEANKIDNLIEKLEKSFKEQFNNLNYENVLVNITGGTKGMTGALILASVSYFPLNKLILYYGERVGNTSETRFSKQEVNKKIIINQLKSIVQTYNYEAIKLFLEQNDYENLFKKIYYAASYGLSRLLCDWERAGVNYSKAKLPTSLLISIKEENIKKFEEAINGIVYTWRHNYLAEFMGRVYNFADKMLVNNILEKVFGRKDMKYNDIISLLEIYPDLEEWLNNSLGKYTEDGFVYVGNKKYLENTEKLTPIRWDVRKYKNLNNGFINLPVGIALVEYLADKEKIDKAYVDYLLRLQDLNQYRNKTIIGHGIKPINKEIIQQKLQTDDVEGFFKSILKELSGKDSLWIDKLNKFLLEEIQSL